MTSELASKLEEIVDCKCGSQWLVDFSAGKNQLVSFYGSNNSSVINWKVNVSNLDEKSFLRC